MIASEQASYVIGLLVGFPLGIIGVCAGAYIYGRIEGRWKR